MCRFAYTKATFNTIVATLFSREIKFKTTEKSVMASTVTDLANKAKSSVKSKTSPLRKAWSKVTPLPLTSNSHLRRRIWIQVRGATLKVAVDVSQCGQ